MKLNNAKNSFVFIIAFVGVLVFINLLGLNVFMHLDLTKDHKFTLSKVSKDTVKNLPDLLTISAYFTQDLPPPYAQNARYVKDLLEEYYSASKDKFAFEFIDPTILESEEDKEKKKNLQKNIFGQIVREPTAIEQELANLGIQPVEIRVIEDDQQKTKRAYMAIKISYQGKDEVIPLVQELSGLEIAITSLMRKLIKEKKEVIGIIKNDSMSSRFDEFIKLLKQEYDVKEITLTASEEIDTSIDALLILGNGDHFGDNGDKKIDKFLKLGKSASFFVDIYDIQTNNFMASAENPRSSTYKIIDLLKSYGVEITTQMVADANCASINMQEQRMGFNFTVPVRYPFIPEIRNLSFESPITKGLTGVLLPFVTTLKIDKKENLELIELAQSSKNSWLMKDPLNLDPKQNWSTQNITPTGPYQLMVQAKGYLPGVVQEGKGKESRLFVVGGSALLWNDFLIPPNQTLALNIVSWLLADTAILDMKTKTFSDVPLSVDVKDATRQLIKYSNIIGVPFLLVIYGLIRWRLREAKRRSVKIRG